jgi:H+/Cl- antiporter ClcA
MNSKKNAFLLLKWIFICVLIGVFSGSASAFFLVTLEWVTQFRKQNNWLIWLLPMGGLCIGFLYHYWGKEVVKGNNLLLEEYENPQKTIPLKMAPLVLIGTLLTHLFGWSRRYGRANGRRNCRPIQ